MTTTINCKYSKTMESDTQGRRYCTLYDGLCHLQYYCNKINAWRTHDTIELENKCTFYKNKEDNKFMAYGKYKVLYSKRDLLCIELDSNTTTFVTNPFDEDKIPLGVDLVKVGDKYYIKGYEPKVTKFKETQK